MTLQREYAIIDIAPGGEADFAALEGRMGLPLAANDTGSPDDTWWYSATREDGSRQRVFTFPSWSRVDLAGLIGPLGAPSVRLTLGYADISSFQPAGPGAERTRRRHPPTLRPAVIDRMYPAANRRRLR